jgi:hypothetical protein
MGGWAALAQSQRHIEDTAGSITRRPHGRSAAWSIGRVERIVLPVEDRAAAQLHDQLSPDFPGVSSASCPALARVNW